MWTCPLCNLQFAKINQVHSCNEKDLSDFLSGKTEHTTELFYYLVNEFKRIGEITIVPTKSIIAFASNKRFAYVTQLGKNFIDVVFPFKQSYHDNFCFSKIKQVPGTNQYNHHLRLYFKEDLNDEVRRFMKMTYESGC